MKAEELMTGDWVYVRDCETYEKVESFTSSKINTNLSDDYPLDDDIVPVPITPEILEMNGFKITGSYYLLQRINYQVKLRMYGNNRWNLLLSSLENGGCCDTVIRYIHQLQHFLRDFEIDKEINLLP